MFLQTTISSSPPLQHLHQHPHCLLPFGSLKFSPHKLSLQALFQHYSPPDLATFRVGHGLNVTKFSNFQVCVPTILFASTVAIFELSEFRVVIKYESLHQNFPEKFAIFISTVNQHFCFLLTLLGDKAHALLWTKFFRTKVHWRLQILSWQSVVRIRIYGLLEKARQIHGKELAMGSYSITRAESIPSSQFDFLFQSDFKSSRNSRNIEDNVCMKRVIVSASVLSFGQISFLTSAQVADAGESIKPEALYEVGELFELGIQLSYLLLLLALLGVGTFFVIRQVLMRRELDLSAKELQEQVRSGDATATGLFELGAVMLRRKFYPAATKYLLQAIEKWDGDDQDLAQVYNALGVSYTLNGKLDKGIKQFEAAVKLQPGYVTAWNNLGDAYEKKKDLKSALKAFEEVLLFDPNNKVARPRRDALKDKVQMYKGVPIKSKDR
ncbi:unnamed protein product [Dovyalis caffra]|uniref:Tetratricopeptide repeat domain-containing protein PYG7, chloroplastic n=1 Tax=Dovyalis caffra TaxID=77055 RepID=A0AAV1QS89_9ROSI|nr:unnamed protein product [Dovyalis caffra]